MTTRVWAEMVVMVEIGVIAEEWVGVRSEEGMEEMSRVISGPAGGTGMVVLTRHTLRIGSYLDISDIKVHSGEMAPDCGIDIMTTIITTIMITITIPYFRCLRTFNID